MSTVNSSKNISTKIIRNLLSDTLNMSSWTVLSVFFLGKATLDMFYNPTYYTKDPSEFLGEANYFLKKIIRRKSLQQSISRLQQYGFVEKTNATIQLTKKGNALVHRFLGFRESLNKEWDGKHRVVIFDIPESKRHHRDWLRSELHFLEYTQLQQSVFVSKFPLNSAIIKEIKDRGIEDGVNYLLVDKIYDIQKMKDLIY